MYDNAKRAHNPKLYRTARHLFWYRIMKFVNALT
nr:MAG TPA: hypothetical protein [Caudoviricetes sp.]DAZ79764.1 MAG TPA: hypothetical protein [Caudoviricetes sp.]